MTRKQMNRWTTFFLVVLAVFVALFYAGCDAHADGPAPTPPDLQTPSEFWAQVAAIAVFLLAIVGLVALYMERRSR